MTERKIYIGSVGPFLFNDTDNLDDADGDFPGQKIVATVSDSPHVAPEFIGMPVMGVSVDNIDDPSPELNILSASDIGGLLAAYESVAGADDEFTLYLWDENAAAENIPYTVDGDGGVWIAVSGKYQNGNINVSGELSGKDSTSYYFGVM
jgi:hypothetical protein